MLTERLQRSRVMIYKGIQKKMIMLKNTDSRYFEEAYFIIKDEIGHSGKSDICENAMIKEANRIISETFRDSVSLCSVSDTKQGFKSSRGFWYSAGLLCGIAVTLAANCLIF